MMDLEQEDKDKKTKARWDFWNNDPKLAKAIEIGYRNIAEAEREEDKKMIVIKQIGETIEVTYSNGTTQVHKITGRNWWGDQFVSYMFELNGQTLTANADGTCEWSINP